jgi:uncharacterized Zn finger protein (UPF0148 family)
MSADGEDRESANLKEAASLLTKGGTLITDPCDLCKGVQVKYHDKIICINCGNEKSAYGGSDSKQQERQENPPVNFKEDGKVAVIGNSRSASKHFERHVEQDNHSSRRDFEAGPDQQEREEEQFLQDRNQPEFGLQNVSSLLIDKISSEIAKVKEEEDPDLLRRKAETIRIFLGLLQRVKEIQRL